MKFYLRDIFWLVLVTAVVTGWCLDHWRLRSDQQANFARWIDTADDWRSELRKEKQESHTWRVQSHELADTLRTFGREVELPDEPGYWGDP